MYALKTKGKLQFTLFAATEKALDDRINNAYRLQKGMRARGSNYGMSDFMEGKAKVKLTIESIEG